LSSTTDQAKREAETEGNRLIGAARSRARSAFEHQQHRVADSIGSVAQALHQAANQLNEQNQDVAARYTDTAAERIERFADSLRDRNVDELVSQAEQYARRQPELFVGGAIALGFVLARFLRTSGNRTAQRGARSSYAGRDGYGTQAGGPQTGRSSSYGGSRGYGSYGGQNRYGQQSSYGSTATGGSYGAGSGIGAGTGSGIGGGTIGGNAVGGSTGSTGSGFSSTPGLGNTGGAGAMERNTVVVGSADRSASTSTSTGAATTSAGAQRPGDPARPNPAPQGSGTASTAKPDDRTTGSTPPRGSNP